MPTREFTLTEGTSDKFWKITLEAATTTVNYGRRGTSGQVQTKDWGSTSEAQKNYDKLIAEKTKKGYVESGGAPAPTAAVAPKPAAPKKEKEAAPAAAKEVAAAAPSAVASGAAVAEPAVSVDFKIERRILKNPLDWTYATWRKFTPPPVEKPRPYDKAALIEQLAKIPEFKRDYRTEVNWREAGLPISMTQEETAFWRLAIKKIGWSETCKEVAPAMGKINIPELKGKWLESLDSLHYLAPEECILVRNAADTGVQTEWICELATRTRKNWQDQTLVLNPALVAGLQRYVFPYLGADQLKRIRETVRPLLDPQKFILDTQFPQVHWWLAAGLGMHAEMEALVRSFPDNAFKGEGSVEMHQPAWLLFGLGDPALVESEFRRLKLTLRDRREIWAWLAHTEMRALDVVVDAIAIKNNRDQAAELAEVLGESLAPEVAPAMVELQLRSKAQKAARQWLDGHMALTLPGLLGGLAGRPRKGVGEASAVLLASYRRNGFADAINSALAAFPADAAKKINAELQKNDTPDLPVLDAKTVPAWLADGISAMGKVRTKVPEWISIKDLPPIILKEEKRRLADDQVAVVLKGLATPTADQKKEELPHDAYYELIRNSCILMEWHASSTNWDPKNKSPKPAPALEWSELPPDDEHAAARAHLQKVAAQKNQQARDSIIGRDVERVILREFFKRLVAACGDEKEAQRLATRGMPRGAYGSYYITGGMDNRCNDEELKKLGLPTLKEESFKAIAKGPKLKPSKGLSFQPVIGDLAANATPESLAAFGWKLFEEWLATGAPSKDKWAFTQLGALGNDATVMNLTPLIRAWPGESQHQRATAGLDVLREIGSDTALMQLNGIAQKLPFKALKELASKHMDAIAEDKGLSKAELEDRIIPDCDLDEKGQCVFDFGPRQFSFVLGADLKPMLRDAAGATKGDLPAPNSKDDAGKAKAAVERWKLMKKQIKDVAKVQAERLEQAMVVGRRWKTEDFTTLLVKHPLATHLVRALLWGGFDAKGKRLGAFRVTDEQDFADAEDAPASLEKYAQIGLLHPMHLNAAERSKWGQVFSDYGLIPPFPQLGRDIVELTADEKPKKEITRFENTKLPAPTLVYGLDKLGWDRAPASDGGSFQEHSKCYPAAGVTAVIEYEGAVAMGYIEPGEILEMGVAYFLPFIVKQGECAGDSKRQAVAAGEIDPIVISETLNDLRRLAAKATT